MPGITINATQVKYDKNLLYILRARPIPLDDDTKQPIMSEAAWVKQLTIDNLVKIAEIGHRMTVKEINEFDGNIFT